MSKKNDSRPGRATTQELPVVGGSETTSEIQRVQVGARLVELVGSQTGRMHRLGGAETFIGREPGLGVQINSSDTSRRHARLFRDDDGEWMIEDLGSRNGTLVNGRPIGRVHLTFGDHVQLAGSVLFVFTYYDHLEEQIHQVQRMEAMGSLASGVAHDFNNLLSVLVGNIDFLDHLGRSGPLEESSLNECLGEMRHAAGRAEQLIRQLLRFARPTEGGTATIDCSQQLHDAVGLCRRTFGPSIKVEVIAAPGLRIHGDPAQVNQVVMNLLINARDAMPDGGRIGVEAELLDLEGEAVAGVPFLSPGPYVRIEVRDTGVGMNEETRRHIFEPFFTTKGADKGTGLGLSTVYALVRKHGGHVQVESELGQGTTFIIFLPALEGSTRRLSTSPLERVHDAAEQILLGHPKVLLVDDDDAVLRTTGRLLRQLGFDVLSATGGKQAIELFTQRSTEIELVILDVLMPDIDGRETLEQLRKLDPLVRVLLISGRVDSDCIDPLLAAGACGFVAKPCGASTLRAAIDQALD